MPARRVFVSRQGDDGQIHGARRDNPTDERPGWNILKDHRTRMPVDSKKWLFERVGRDASVRERFMKLGTRSVVNREAIERYMGRVINFREKLAVLKQFV
jgi:hypothetical protein